MKWFKCTFVFHCGSNLFCLTYLLTLIRFYPFCRLPILPLLSFTSPFFKSHLGLPGMSHRSSTPSGVTPLIFKGHVHLLKQWIKKHPEAKMRGFSSRGWKDRKGAFWKATGKVRPSPATVWLLASNSGAGTHPPGDHLSPLQRVQNKRSRTNVSAKIKSAWKDKHLQRGSGRLRTLMRFSGVSRSLKGCDISSIQRRHRAEGRFLLGFSSS